MEKKSIWILIFSLLILTVLSILTYIEDNIAILFTSIIYISIGILFSLIINNFKDIRNSIYIFLLFFLVYLLYTIFVHYGASEVYNTPYIKSDESSFYAESNNVFLKLKYGYTFFELDRIYKEGTAAVYLYGLVATLANYFGENSILVLKISVIFIGSLIPVLMYNLSRLYLSEKISITVAIIYGFFSFVPYLSSVLLRDVHVALVFLIAIYIVLQRLTFLNFIIFILISFISYYLRPQTGLFMMGFMVVPFFVFVRKMVTNKYIEIFLYLILTTIITIIVLNSDLMSVYNETANSSGNKPTVEKASGMGAKIAELPTPINTIAMFGYGQMQPFPPSWLFKGHNKGIFQISYLISGIVWFIGWGFLLYGLFKKKILSKVDLKLKLMFFISILYLILIASISFGMRRQMSVYPVLYLFMVFSYLEMNVTERTKIWVGMSFFYIILVLIINYLKL